MTPTLLYKFMWKQFVPDRRAYKPSAPVIETNCAIGVQVPLTPEFILNAVDIMQAQIASGNGEVPDPVLTPLGMRYCIDQFEMVMSDPTTDTTNDTTAWDEGEDDTPKSTKKETPKEEWEDEPETTTKQDVDWDESWEV